MAQLELKPTHKVVQQYYDFHEKQTFLNTVYERFFQGYSEKEADTMGIVYTPQPLVHFMIASVEQVLKKEFGKSLADRDVHIIDPFTGTGNFIVNIMRHMAESHKSALPHKYANELWCNEIMLLPYYVASMNIEHAYCEATGKNEPFEGICLVDTFQTAEKEQAELSFFSEKNTERVDRQKKAPIRVVIANPPYNAGQMNENDNNKNRKYPEIDRRVKVTYMDSSKATLKRKYNDPYIKAVRYATDRIGESGVVCYVNNNSFFHDPSFDGIRMNLEKDFDLIYVLDLGGNVRKNPTLSGTTHNVFGIQLGVSINLFIRLPRGKDAKRTAKIYYHPVGKDWRKEQKYSFLETRSQIEGVKWQKLLPDAKGNWITNDTDEEFDSFLPIGSKDAKAGSSVATIFRTYSLGASTNRDSVVFDFDAKRLTSRVKQFIEDYDAERYRWKTKARPPADIKLVSDYIDKFVSTEKVKWSETLKKKLIEGASTDFAETKIRSSIYRPFTRMSLYYDNLLIDRPGAFAGYFPKPQKSRENRALAVNLSPERPFCPFICDTIPSKDVAGGFGSPTNCFPIFTYSDDGKHKQDNITPKARTLFQIFYDDDTITQADIFHYIYAVLHHPVYSTRFAENLKRELPRIPFIGVAGSEKDASFFPVSALEKMQGNAKPGHNPKASAKLFHAFADAGKKLADLHVNYESAKEFPLKRQENKEAKLDWRVETMRLSKEKASLIYNDFLTLSGIPAEVYDYRLGNRSGLEWVIDQYRVTKDDQGNIASDPNHMDDEQYIVRLIGQVITVSLETMKIVNSFPRIVQH